MNDPQIKRLHEIAHDLCNCSSLAGFEYFIKDNKDIDGLHWCASIRRINGQQLHISNEPQHNENPTQIHISGFKIQDKYNGGGAYNYDDIEPCSINISIKKDISKIAAEIQKRYMPAYDENHAQAEVIRKERTERRLNIEKDLKEIQSTLDTGTLLYLQGLEYGRSTGRSDSSHLELSYIESAPRGEIKVNYSDDNMMNTFRLNLDNLTLDHVKQIADVVRLPRQVEVDIERLDQARRYRKMSDDHRKELDENINIIRSRLFDKRRAISHKQTYANPYKWPRD